MCLKPVSELLSNEKSQPLNINFTIYSIIEKQIKKNIKKQWV